MNSLSVDVAIIGAGTAGISAFKEASKVTDNIILIDHGPLGTTCARVGCMPSKALIQTANYYHNRAYLAEIGVDGANTLRVDLPRVMEHVRKLRDHFTSSMVEYIESLGNQFIQGKAKFIEKNMLSVNNQKIIAKSIIIATGSTSIIPLEYAAFRDEILTSENIFDQKNFLDKISVIGAGPIGLELGQALSRLGLVIEMFHAHNFIGGLSDPAVNDYAIKYFSESFSLHLGHQATVLKQKNGFLIKSGEHDFSTDQVLAALGRNVNLSSLNLDGIGVKLNKAGLPVFDSTTMQIEDLPIYIAGDVGKVRPVLHEAADDGRIAGYNAVRENPECFIRRVPMAIIFSEPNIAVVGKAYDELQSGEFVVGEVKFEDQGRARIMSQNRGLLRIYASPTQGTLLGAEMIAPEGEHLAHILAHSIQQNVTVFDLLKMPFYYPVIEEGVRTALRSILPQIEHKCSSIELAMCDSSAISNLS